MLAGVSLTAFVAGPATSHATTITGNIGAWNANAGAFVSTPSIPPGDGNPVSAFTLADGTNVTLAGSADYIYTVGFDWGAWSNGFTGNVVDSTNNTETLTLSPGVSAFAVYVSPDLGLLLNTSDTITVSLSDGTTAVFSGNYPSPSPQFVGFYGGSDITSVTISTANAQDFAFGDFNPVPEPLSISVMAVGLAGIGLVRRRGRR
jgi:hypothetical protein